MTLAYYNALNELVDLAGAVTSQVLFGVQGRFMPPFGFVEDETPNREGARIRRVKVPPREVTVPMLFFGDTSTGLRDQLRILAHRLNPLAGDGRLQSVDPAGRVRELTCRYSQGFEGDESTADGGLLSLAAVLVFRAAEDPYWHDRDATVLEFGTGSPPAFFPFFPLTLAGSTIVGGITIENPGDIEAWPIWTITGPGSGLTLTNDTTGESLELSTVLGGGDTLTIDTTPGVKTVTLYDGSNLYGDLSSGPSLWPLAPGENHVSVTFTDSTADSLVSLSFRARYLVP